MSYTIREGIDHGTMNSALARMGPDGPEAVRIDGDEIVPSCVYFAKSGAQFYGRQAYRTALVARADEGDGCYGYKPNLGTTTKIALPATGGSTTPRELGAMVLRKLLQGYREQHQTELRACVITVPAKFNDTQRNATREVAYDAGLVFAPLLQEPVAAALAYGFENLSEQGLWLVFDLGAGTLDVSLVKSEDGRMTVPEGGHAGDNELGGRTFDRELAAYVLGPRRRDADYDELRARYKELDPEWTCLRDQYALEDFSIDRPGGAAGQLHLAIEAAKIELSKRESAVVELEGASFKDAEGKPVQVEIPIKRHAYEQLILPHAERAAQICLNLMRENRLQAADVGRIILVGGPTKTPLIRKVLEERIGVALDHSIDPMTAVSKGAAIFALTVEVPPEIVEQLRPKQRQVSVVSGHTVALESVKSTDAPTAFVSGTVTSVAGIFDGLTVEIARGDGRWRSERMAVDEDGFFECDAALATVEGRATESSFVAHLFGDDGQVVAESEPITVFHRLPEGSMRLANSILIGLEGNATHALLEANLTVPGEATGVYYTNAPLQKGKQGSVLEIQIYEALTNHHGTENRWRDCCVRRATFPLKAEDLAVDLPAGREVHITLSIDIEQRISVVAHFPDLNEDFEEEYPRDESLDVSVEEIRQRLQRETFRLEEIRKIESSHPTAAVTALLGQLDRIEANALIEREVGRSEDGDPTALKRGYENLLKLAGTVYELQDLQWEQRLFWKLESLEALQDKSRKDELKEIRTQLASIPGGDGRAPYLGQLEAWLERIDDAIRYVHYQNLLVAVKALSGRRVNPQQHVVFKEADAVCGRMIDKGFWQHDRDDIKEMQAARQRLADNYPDLEASVSGWRSNNPTPTRDAGVELIRRG